MLMERTIQDLSAQLLTLQENSLQVLRATVVEDRPPQAEAAIVDQLEDTILDQMGLLDESLRAAQRAAQAVAHQTDLDQVRLALATSGDRLHEIRRQFSADVVAFEMLKDLDSLGARGGSGPRGPTA